MVTGIVEFVAGVTAGAVSFLLLRDILAHPLVTKENYAGRSISSLGGLVFATALLIGAVASTFFTTVGSTIAFSRTVIILILGFGLIGFLDDVLGDKSKQGFKGHISSLLNGKITTGTIKLFGGPAVVFLALSNGIDSRGYIPVFIDVIAICLIANFFNLLDLAPGRCTKYSLVAFIAIAIVAPHVEFQYFIVGVAALCFVLDVREQFMLGDIGANIIGAIVGLFAVSALSDRNALILLCVALLLNIVSEFISYSRIISRVVPLRYFDYLGQTSDRRTWAEAKRRPGLPKGTN